MSDGKGMEKKLHTKLIGLQTLVFCTILYLKRQENKCILKIGS